MKPYDESFDNTGIEDTSSSTKDILFKAGNLCISYEDILNELPLDPG